MKDTHKSDCGQSKKLQIHLKVTEAEHKEIEEHAKAAHMTMTDYIKSGALSGKGVTVVQNGVEMLPHLAKLSSYANMVEYEALGKEIRKEVQFLWQYLSPSI